MTSYVHTQAIPQSAANGSIQRDMLRLRNTRRGNTFAIALGYPHLSLGARSMWLAIRALDSTGEGIQRSALEQSTGTTAEELDAHLSALTAAGLVAIEGDRIALRPPSEEALEIAAKKLRHLNAGEPSEGGRR